MTLQDDATLRGNASPVVARIGQLAAERPGDLAYRHLPDDGEPAVDVTYRQLAGRVSALAAELAPLGPGARVVLTLPPGAGYVCAFLGCLAASVIAVPLQPRPGLRPTAEGLARHPLVADSGATAALTVHGLVDLAPPPAGPAPGDAAADIAFLQYTSGSTGTPKGVMVTHANLAHNLAAIQEGMSIGAGDGILVWLPPYHDMGLIGGILEPLWAGVTGTLLTPQAFARRPLTWLEAISAERPAVSGGPNFAFDMCVDRTTPEQRAALDLSSWKVAFSGSEPVRPATMRRFAEAFAPAGFRAGALYACYGLAESTLIVSGSRRGAGLTTVPHPEGDGELVSCGRVVGGQRLKVVDPASGESVPDGETGEVLVRGGSVTAGYWRKPEASALAFTADGWLRTGDLGMLVAGELCVHGRRKDSIIIRGRNLFPEDIEEEVRAAEPALRGAAAAAFGVVEADGERLVVVVEVATSRDDTEATFTRRAARIRAAVTSAAGVSPAAVAFVRRGQLPRTTSGKVRRSASRAAYIGAGLRLLAEDRLTRPAHDGTALPPMLTRQAVGRLEAGERVAALTGSLRSWVAAATGVPAGRVDVTLPPAAAGLDSLMLVQLQGDIAARLALRLPAADLAAATSLEALAATLADRLAETPEQAPHPAPATPREPAHAAPDTEAAGGLTPAQIASWYQDRRHEGTSVNVLSRAFTTSAPVDVPVLEATLRLLAERHPALRTAFDAVDGVPTARLLPATGLRVRVVDGRHWSQKETDVFLREEAATPFAPARDALLRASVVRGDGHDLLVLTAHHAAVDLWSASLLLAEFDTVHRALTAGEDPAPAPADAAPPLPTGTEESRRWWAATLSTAAASPRLPADSARAATAALATRLVLRTLPEASADGVRALALRLGVSPFSLLLAAWKAVLFGYAGHAADTTPVTVGAPASGRGRPEARSFVGFLANPLPLRTDVSAGLPFDELARRVHATVLAALDHQDLPFSSIVEAAGASRSDGRNPLFDALFVLHQPPAFAPPGTAAMALGAGGARLELGALRLRALPVPPPHAPVEATMEIVLGDDGEATSVALKCARDVFDARTAESMLDGYTAVLRRVLADPRRRVADLIGTAEPVPLESAPARLGGPPDVVGKVYARAAARPDAIAVRQGQRALSYRGLLAASSRLARHLRTLGVRPETRVGLALPRTPDLVVAMLAVLQAGGAYFPLDVALPATRKSALLADTEPVLVLTTAAGADRVPGGVTRLVLDDPDVRRRLAAYDAGPVNHVVHPQQLAYVLFTSGSTGRPKSVALAHGGVAALADWAAGAYRAHELAAVLAGTPLVFDLSVFELLVTLTAGGTVVLAEHTLDLPRLPERAHVTLVNTVPSLAAELCAQGLPPGVRTVNLAGEPLPAPLARHLAAAGAERILNLYGPSEDTTYSTAAEVDPASSRLITIGRPLPGCAAYVVTAGGRFSDAATPGELLLTGPKVARGYLGAPGASAERFVPDPGGRSPGARAYRTGDEARRRHDGELVFVGRTDRQVKLRGVRIEPAEVEAVLGGCPGVTEAAVRVHHAGRADAVLVAYVAGGVPEADLHRHAAGALPSALVPRRYVRLERLPRTASDKLDRAALAAIPVPEREPVLARRAMTRAERLVADAWSAVLDVEAPDADTDFFLQGGHSLLAMRLLAAVETSTGVRVPLERLFARPTIAGIAAHIETASAQAPAAPKRDEQAEAEAETEGGEEGEEKGEAGEPGRHAVAEAPGDDDGLFPLSPTQERFWLIQSLDPDDVTYNVAAVLRLDGPLDPARLERALSAVVARHAALRTRVVRAKDEPRQQILAAKPVRLTVTDAGESEAAALAEADARTPFRLDAGPAWRVRLLRLPGGAHRLVFAAHHIICDGWSLELFARDVGAAYAAGARAGSPAPSFVHWAARQQRSWSEAGDKQLRWWREHLAGMPDLHLPADRQRDAGSRRTGAVVSRRLPSAALAALDALCRREGATRFAALTALLGAVLARHSGQDDFGIGMPVAARTSPDTHDLFGCVANTVVLRTDLTGSPTFRDLLRRTWREVRAAIAHQDVPFSRVVRDLAAGGAVETSPLFQVMIADQPRDLGLTLGEVRCAVTPLPTATAKFDLSVLIETAAAGGDGGGDGVDLGFEYDATLFDEATVGALADRFVRLAEAVAHQADTPVAALDLASPAERDLVARWGDGGPLPDVGVRLLHEIVLAQAARTPDSIAVTARDGALSYRELAARAARLAAGLRRRGIGAEDRVAICHERTASLPVAMLGILAAGAAYLPLRLEDPAERRAEMLADAEVRLVLCDPETRTWLDTWDVPLATVDEVAAEAPDGAPVAGPVGDEQLAYVLYTSGSTGRPKGVAVTHKGALARIVWARTSFTDQELGGVLAATSLGFDLSLFELLAPLSAGGTAVIAENILDLPTLPDRARISLVTTVPSSMTTVLDMAGWPSTVRTVGLGGEPLPVQLARRVADLNPERVVNLYGTTEDSFCSTWTPLTGDRVTVGHPLPGTRVSVVDDALTVLPPGAMGEIAAAGVGVSRGYLRRPGLTAASYLPDPQGPPGSRLYRTGDRGRFGPHGLQMAGRLDGQAKIRGHRVELGEVEAAVLAVDGVAEVAVLIEAGPVADSARLVAYVRPAADAGPPDAARVRAALRRRLPDYMLPSAFVAVDAMPRTQSGKLDRAALAARAASGVLLSPDAGGGDGGEPPQPGTETAIAAVWQELLDRPVHRRARFFDLGGDSLLAARMTTRVNDLLDADLSIRTIFDDDRLTAFAAQVEREESS